MQQISPFSASSASHTAPRSTRNGHVPWLLGAAAALLLATACTGDIQDRTSSLSVPAVGGAGGCLTPGCATATPLNCTGSQCVCPAGQNACGSSCVSLLTDTANCGGCGHSCGAGGACLSGQCVCTAGTVSCSGTCVDTSRDAAQCGMCGHACKAEEMCQQGQCQPKAGACSPACTGGRACNAGMCVCPANLSFCADACVDLQTTPQHCGDCNTACTPSQLCQAGKCACPPGQMTCGTECVDLQTSTTNCGACMKACATGEVCMAGTCRGAAGADGCDGGPAHELNLREISAYQTIKIPLMQKGTAVAKAQRVAAVIEGRPTLFRAFVDTGSAFSAREFSARLNLTNASGKDQYFAKQQISKASTDADTASTFQIYVPADKVHADTTYSLELVECATGTGSMMTSRFPATGESPLEPRKTGILKVTVIPVETNSRKPDTSDTALAIYRAYLEAMYPIEKAEIKVGTSITTAYPVNWQTLLEQIRTQRQTDKAPADQYFFGLMQPTATLKEYCRSGCTAGIGYVASSSQPGTRAAVGLAYADEMSAATMAHELGHNHGRNHAPCAPGNNISGVDGSFPYTGAKIGSWGYDPRKRVFFNPDTTLDIMGYCDPKWISDYTYKGLVDRVAAVNGVMLQLADPASIARYQVMIVDHDGPRWSQPFLEPAEPFGTPESADVLDIDGQFVESVSVYRTQMSDSTASTILVPEAQPGWNAIKLADALPLPFSAPVTVPRPVTSEHTGR